MKDNPNVICEETVSIGTPGCIPILPPPEGCKPITELPEPEKKPEEKSICENPLENVEKKCQEDINKFCGTPEKPLDNKGNLISCTSRTPNFIIQTNNPQLAGKFACALEYYRCKEAIEWIGQPLGATQNNPRGRDWTHPAVVTINVGPNIGNGGATTFIFDRGEVSGWRMTLQGDEYGLLVSTIPHEVQHMISATNFRKPILRWIDEGISTSTENCDEKDKHRKMLIQFLRTNRGISFNQLFAMTEYPRDIMPLYAQGWSLTEYLLIQGGGGCTSKRKLYDFLGEGLNTRDWNSALKKYYNINNIGELQNKWLDWVRRGLPGIPR